MTSYIPTIHLTLSGFRGEFALFAQLWPCEPPKICTSDHTVGTGSHWVKRVSNQMCLEEMRFRGNEASPRWAHLRPTLNQTIGCRLDKPFSAAASCR